MKPLLGIYLKQNVIDTLKKSETPLSVDQVTKMFKAKGFKYRAGSITMTFNRLVEEGIFDVVETKSVRGGRMYIVNKYYLAWQESLKTKFNQHGV